MNYKEFTKKSYGLEAKEVPPKPMTYSDVKEDIRVSDPTGKKKAYAKVKGEEKIYSKNANEDYFDNFRNKEKLRTKAEQILEKDDRE